MAQNDVLGWADECEPGAEEEDVLDEAELNRLAYLAEHPELTDPVFLLIRPGSGGGR